VFKSVVKRHGLWLGFAAVVLPLAVLLSMQYVWLADLQEKSAVAGTAHLQNYLESVSDRVEYFYRAQAEQSLNLPGSLFAVAAPKGPNKIGHYFKKREPEGAKALFVVNLVEDWRGILVFDPRERRFVQSADAGMLQAIFIAIAPWKTLAHKGVAVQAHGISVEEKDKDNRIILNPITDDESQVLGLVGMVVDNDHFRRVVLPSAIEKSVPGCEGNSGSPRNLLCTVHDGQGHLVLGESRTDDGAMEVTGRLAYIFSDWQLGLGGGTMTAEEWARSNFTLNVSLSALLALVLVGGIVLALRTASREIKLSRMKSDFVSNVSHELRTPIASIRVFGEFLRLGRAESEDKRRRYGEYIETESRRLTQLINNILDFSKIESGAKTYDFETSQIETIVGEAARTLEVGLRHKGVRLRYEHPDTPLPPIEVDPDAITQAVSNLVDNAVKYSGGSEEVQLTLSRSNGEALISVEDTGIGISREEQGKIFDRFHRVSTGLVHNVKGSGLGLSIVSHIARAHGGSVSVHSEPGQGSTFTIHLPLVHSVRVTGRDGSVGHVEDS
jgi:signal transduction histidine kinase